MADISDIEAAFAHTLESVIYPNGLNQPSVSGADVLIFRGWPDETQLNGRVTVGKDTVTIFAKDGGERQVTNHVSRWRESSLNQKPSLVAVLANDVLTFSGDCSRLPINVALKTTKATYAYQVVSGDTPSTVATHIAAQIYGAVANGPVVQFPDPGLLTDDDGVILTDEDMTPVEVTVETPRNVGVGTKGKCYRELRRQERHIMITIWAASPSSRDKLGKVIDTYFAKELRLPLAEGTTAFLTYIGTKSDDALQKAKTFRRDLIYSVEYPTIEIADFYDVINASANHTAAAIETITERI